MTAFPDDPSLQALSEDLEFAHWVADAERERGGPITDWEDLVCVVETLGTSGALPPEVLLGHLEPVFGRLADVQVGPPVSLYLTAPDRTDRQAGFSPWDRSRPLHPLERRVVVQDAMLACLRSGARSVELLPDEMTVRAVWLEEPSESEPE